MNSVSKIQSIISGSKKIFFSSFDFCDIPSEWADKDPPENLGQVVFGDRLRASPYKIIYRKNVTNQNLCTKQYKLSVKKDRKVIHFLRERIIEGYMHAWVIDNMPVTWCYHMAAADKQFCTTRFPIGCHVSKDGVRQDSCYISVSQTWGNSNSNSNSNIKNFLVIVIVIYYYILI